MDLVYRKYDGVFVDTTPIDIAKILPKDWSPKPKGIKVYWIVDIISPTRTYESLAIYKKNPQGQLIDSETIQTNEWEESYAPLTDISGAADEYQSGSRIGFEEFPYVEVESETAYNFAVLGEQTPKDWSPRKKESAWEGPGVYDFRDRPPTRAYESLKAYEMAGMEERARQVWESSWGDEGIEEPLRKLLARHTS